MLLATARRRPTHSMHLKTTRPPRVWTDLPLEHQLRVAHVVAVLVHRIRQQPQVDSCCESLEILT
jgi:hypothetical protein